MPPNISGDYRKIVEGVNNTLDAVIGPLNVSAEYVDRISKGDIPPKITDKYNGDFNEIKNNLNTCIDAVNCSGGRRRYAGEGSDGGQAGYPGGCRQAPGDFRKIVDGVNNTIARLVGFLDSMPAPAMIIDKDMNVRYINEIGAKVGGRTPQQVAGGKCYDHFKTSDCKTERCACHLAIRDNRLSTSEADAHPTVGIDLDISYTGVPIKDELSNVIGAFEVVTDQTAVKKAARLASKVADYQNIETAKVVDAISKLSQGNTEIHLVTAEGDGDTKTVKETLDTIANAVNAVSQWSRPSLRMPACSAMQPWKVNSLPVRMPQASG